MSRQRRKFSLRQTVVFQFLTKNYLGTVVGIKPHGKNKFIYDVLGEDGKIYHELGVDTGYGLGIDTKLTRIWYKSNGIDETKIPEVISDAVENAIKISNVEQAISGPSPFDRDETPKREFLTTEEE